MTSESINRSYCLLSRCCGQIATSFDRGTAAKRWFAPTVCTAQTGSMRSKTASSWPAGLGAQHGKSAPDQRRSTRVLVSWRASRAASTSTRSGQWARWTGGCLYLASKLSTAATAAHDAKPSAAVSESAARRSMLKAQGAFCACVAADAFDPCLRSAVASPSALSSS